MAGGPAEAAGPVGADGPVGAAQGGEPASADGAAGPAGTDGAAGPAGKAQSAAVLRTAVMVMSPPAHPAKAANTYRTVATFCEGRALAPALRFSARAGGTPGVNELAAGAALWRRVCVEQPALPAVRGLYDDPDALGAYVLTWFVQFLSFAAPYMCPPLAPQFPLDAHLDTHWYLLAAAGLRLQRGALEGEFLARRVSRREFEALLAPEARLIYSDTRAVQAAAGVGRGQIHVHISLPCAGRGHHGVFIGLVSPRLAGLWQSILETQLWRFFDRPLAFRRYEELGLSEFADRYDGGYVLRAPDDLARVVVEKARKLGWRPGDAPREVKHSPRVLYALAPQLHVLAVFIEPYCPQPEGVYFFPRL